MNIVYGVSGEGLGHVFEASEIAAILRRDGHSIKILTYGDRACDALRDYHPTRIEGVPLYFNAKGLSIIQTIVKNLHCIPFYLKNGRRLRRELAAFEPDVFLTAYEPFCTLAAHVFGKPLVSMDNQNALLFLRSRPTGHWVSSTLARITTRIVTFGADYYIIKAFERHPSPRGNVHFVAPIVQEGIRKLKPSIGTDILVYLTKPNTALIGILRTIEESFVVYTGDQEGRDGNVVYRARGPSFLPDLAACKAIIGTTGFSLIADAIHLGKPYFGVPLKGQFEQTVNAMFLADSRLGESSESPTKEAIESFLSRLDTFRSRIAQRSFDSAEQAEALRRVLKEIAENSRRPLTTASPALSPE